MKRFFLLLVLALLLNLFSITPASAHHDPTAPGFIPNEYCDENEIWKDNTTADSNPTGHTFQRYCTTGTRCVENIASDGSTQADCQALGTGGTSKFELGPKPAGLTQLEDLFKQVVNVSVYLAFAAVLVVMVVASIKFITSGGEPKAIAAARDAIVWALLGVLFLAIAWLVLQLISAFTGIEILKTFNIKILCGAGGC